MGFRRVAAGAVYKGVVRDLVLRLKFSGARSASWPLACFALYGAYRAIDSNPIDCVIPVPLHPLRRWKRGYNQAELIGRHVADQLGLPFLKGVIKRTKATFPQGKGGGGSRRKNVYDAFSPIKDDIWPLLRGEAQGSIIKDCHLLLVDDVLSTGATMDACSRALLEAGALSITGAVAAT